MNKWVSNSLLGGLVGIAVSQILALLFSWKNGFYLPCSEQMIEQYGMLPAATLEMISSFVLGSVFACAGRIWQTRWSLTAQTVTFYVLSLGTYLSAAWINFWMEHTWLAVFRILFIFTLIFALIWIVLWFSIQKNLREINDEIRHQNL